MPLKKAWADPILNELHSVAEQGRSGHPVCRSHFGVSNPPLRVTVVPETICSFNLRESFLGGDILINEKNARVVSIHNPPIRQGS